MTALAASAFSVDEFLAEERTKDLFRFSTAGSVDDGKSTLIGRLLYDTQSVYDDQVRSIQGKGTTAPGQIDFALLTDGLRAEREQGITIDVAYRYFSTARRKFIIADTPGHEQYTRNMATGASTADAAVVLIDASKGVLVQSRRHAYIASLLRVRHILVAVNKMDLIGYDEGAFRAIERDFSILLDQIAADTGNPVEPVFVPVSALAGDNIVHRSDAMSWYDGPSLLELLESLPSSLGTQSAPFRLPVQRVLRPDHTFRGFAGQIASGTVRPGDKITVLPSGRSAEVERIVTWDGDLTEAHAPLSVTLVLNHELDISRGDLIVSAESPATVVKSLKGALVWMDQRPLERGRRYLLKHTSQTVPAVVSSVEHRTNITSLSQESSETLEMNAIGVVSIQLLRPIALDPYGENRSTGAFILIDPETNSTVAAGMVTVASAEDVSAATAAARLSGRVSAQERAARWGHYGGVVELDGPIELIDAIERSLFATGKITFRIERANPAIENHPELLELVLQSSVQSGLIALVVTSTETGTLTARADGEQLTVVASDTASVVSAVHQLLSRVGILPRSERAIIQ
ncbi:sulfate adenylyltransferase subunit CysN [Acidicapsa acidisoli]|uniref:sulfate adenylyltransferase subunit CysN n=1 Tax=Acidicapsa acidisoli TaxID=1615681 RepID=UPI0021DFE168|nr:sulfate adenylyltransferase subunit CysN [Acidicapsa acidisoli]